MCHVCWGGATSKKNNLENGSILGLVWCYFGAKKGPKIEKNKKEEETKRTKKERRVQNESRVENRGGWGSFATPLAGGFGSLGGRNLGRGT